MFADPVDPPQINEMHVHVVWNEPFISAGSVSQYVLTATPPTSDCQSGSGDCVLMTDQTQYNFTVTVDQIYSLTVRADTCRNIQIGNSSNETTIELIGWWRVCVVHMYMYMYMPLQSALCYIPFPIRDLEEMFSITR